MTTQCGAPRAFAPGSVKVGKGAPITQVGHGAIVSASIDSLISMNRGTTGSPSSPEE